MHTEDNAGIASGNILMYHSCKEQTTAPCPVADAGHFLTQKKNESNKDYASGQRHICARMPIVRRHTGLVIGGGYDAGVLNLRLRRGACGIRHHRPQRRACDTAQCPSALRRGGE